MTSASEAALGRAFAAVAPYERRGRISWAFGTTVRATGLSVRIGQSCEIVEPGDSIGLPAEVVGFSDGAAILAPLRPLRGLGMDAEVVPCAEHAQVPFGPGLLGRVIDSYGAPLDGAGSIQGQSLPVPLYNEAPPALDRAPIDRVFQTGIRVVDGLLTVGVGQRIGVFAPAGVGKSMLLGMIARHSRADVNVIGLVGERGREVGDFLRDALGKDGLSRSIVVVATSDRPPLERIRAANAATAIAEAFRSEGRQVLLLVDSVTRYARALREVGLSMGEPAVRRGFPPSVFAELPRLLERAGPDKRAAMTAFYTVLTEDEGELDPIGEEVRSILDGHITLSRRVAGGGVYPAVDLPASVSRLFHQLAHASHRADAETLRSWLLKLDETAFLRQLGEYAPGQDHVADLAISREDATRAFLRQAPEEAADLGATLTRLSELVGHDR